MESAHLDEATKVAPPAFVRISVLSQEQWLPLDPRESASSH